MKKTAIYAGTFDPVTYGHIDLIERALRIFDEVIVAVANNPAKRPLFTIEERLKLLRSSVGRKKGIHIDSFGGLLVDYASEKNVKVIIRGIRALSDFEFEFQMALSNRKLNSKIETIFLMPHESYAYLSSRLIKEVVSLGGDVSFFVPPCVSRALKEKLG
ncbi:MAG: pantetheine-phosphate adenylyltransferase [Candidatus Omnitrophica bacterium]|nr:pantetheine-phosphate adenylyltransferase [Candidatus Omnitrophota bacterium]